jgi:hypothetical protein
MKQPKIGENSKPRQGDLFTGEFNANPPKRGNGYHIKLTAKEAEPTAVPGMADFAGGGPPNTYCRNCVHFGEEIAVQTGINTIERTRRGCAIWSRRMGRAAPSPRRDIRLCRSLRALRAGRRIAPLVHHR